MPAALAQFFSSHYYHTSHSKADWSGMFPVHVSHNSQIAPEKTMHEIVLGDSAPLPTPGSETASQKARILHNH